MSRTSDILTKAQSLREQHQKNIDEKLKVDMQNALEDTRSFVNQRLTTISKDMEKEIEHTQANLKDNLEFKKQNITTSIELMEKEVSKDAKEFQENLRTQLQSMKEDLLKLNGLSQVTAEQAKLRKTLFSSNIVLASIALISLITSISFAYVSKSKYNDLKAMEAKVLYLKQNGGSLNLQTCGDSKTARLCVQVDPTAPHYENNFVVVKETN